MLYTNNSIILIQERITGKRAQAAGGRHRTFGETRACARTWCLTNLVAFQLAISPTGSGNEISRGINIYPY